MSDLIYKEGGELINLNTRELLQAPASNLDPEWALAFNSIQNPSPFSWPRKLKDDRDALVVMREYEWLLKLHYVYRLKWDSGHRLPIRQRPEAQKAIRLEAEWLYRILELCIQCHAVLPREKRPYENAARWFDCIVWELKNAQFKAISDRGLTGTADIKEQRRGLGCLRNYKNPFSAEDHSHYHRLVGAAIQLAEEHDQFRRSYWRPYLSAYTAYINNVEASDAYVSVFLDQEGRAHSRPKRLKQSRRTGRATIPLASIQPLFEKVSSRALLP